MSVYTYQSLLDKKEYIQFQFTAISTKFTNFSPYVTSTRSTNTSTLLDLLYDNFLSTSEFTNTVSLKIKFACKGIES
jgi:hypothetical protein